MYNHTVIIILIIFLSGVLGGITNSLISIDRENNHKAISLTFFKSIFISISASLTVPLFLQIISNNLLDIPEGGHFPHKNYFILMGFCVIASLYSSRFLDDLYSRVIDAEKKADEAKELAEVNSKEKIEDDNLLVVDNIIGISNSNEFDKQLKEDATKIASSILNSKYVYRTVKGIASETQLPHERVDEILMQFKMNNLIDTKKNKSGVDVWRIIDR